MDIESYVARVNGTLERNDDLVTITGHDWREFQTLLDSREQRVSDIIKVGQHIVDAHKACSVDYAAMRALEAVIQDNATFRTEKVYKTYVFPHRYSRRRLWRKVCIGFRYFVNDLEYDQYGRIKRAD